MSLQETWNCKNDCKACSWHLIFFRLVSKYCCFKKSTIPSPLTASQSQSDAIPSPALSLPPTMPSLHSVTPSLHTHSDLFLPSLFVPDHSSSMQQRVHAAVTFSPPRPAASWYFHFLPQKVVAFKNCYKYVWCVCTGQWPGWGTVNVCTEKLILHHPISDSSGSSSSCQVVMFSFNKLRFCPADGQ